MSLKLTYFNAPGRAYAIRTCLRIAGISFEDKFLTFPEFQAAKFSIEVPLGSVPTLTLPSGKVVTQSVAIARYAAKLANLYPLDPEEALQVDELVDVVGDILSSAPQNPDADVKKDLREKWAAGKLKVFMNYLNAKAVEASSGPLVGGKLSLADIVVYGSLSSIQSGGYDFVPGNYVDEWPALIAFVNNYENHPVTGPHKIAPKN